MPQNALSPTRAARIAIRAMLGPQGLSILSGVLLAGYWFGGEGLLLFAALAIPGAIALISLVTGSRARIFGLDGLTGLYNRSSALRQLRRLQQEAPQTGRSAACLVLALDEFEALERVHDAAAVDEVLVRTAERLHSAMRDADIVARIGRSSFAVIPAGLRNPDLETGIQLSARLLAAVAEPVALGPARIHVTGSVGFVLPRQLTEPSAEEMMEAAECALLEARQQGRGTIRAFTPQERRPRVIPSKLAEDVADALESDQIRAWFQPQVSTDTGAVVGFEALARWDHPVHGMIAPGEFLPAVAAAGRSARLSQTMLDQALTALRGWHGEGLDVPQVSVNLGQEELRDPRLPERIGWELDRFDLAPEQLCIEILETVLLPDAQDVVTRNIATLSEMGVAIDLDDFGTGTASIAAIRRFAVDRIKIDRSFVTRIDSDRGQQEMAAAILSMAERLGLDTLAEGVETIGEHAMLAQLGCGAVQGYGIAPPMPYEETLDWIRRHQARIAQLPGIGRKVV